MIVRVAGTLLLSVRREWRTASTLTFGSACAKSRAYRGSEGTSLLLGVGRTEPSSRIAAAEHAPSSVPTSKGWLLCRSKQASTRSIIVVVGSATKSSESAGRSCGSCTTAEKATPACSS